MNEMILHSVSLDTPVGEFHMLVDGDETVCVSGFGDIQSIINNLPEGPYGCEIVLDDDHKYADLIRAYFDGDMTALNKIPHQQSGTTFRQAAWHALEKIPAGRTVSYAQLAQAAGNPNAIRAAGTVCASNRLVLIVPCHRVIKSDGTLGNYLYGSEIKRQLLGHEAKSTHQAPA